MTEAQLIRFLPKFIVNSESGCWRWIASARKGSHYVEPFEGYGQFYLRTECGHQVIREAHRVSYEHWVGLIPTGLHIDHLCRNTLCVNPDHLEAVTCYVNLHRGRGRTARYAQKTHCIRGHQFTADNIRRANNGTRHCKTCERAKTRAWNEMVRFRRMKAAK